MKLWVTHPNYFLFIVLLALCMGPAVAWLGLSRGVLVGFDAAAIGFLLAAVGSMRDASADRIREHAARNDGDHAWLTAVTALVLGVVLTAVAVESNGSGGILPTKVLPLVTLAIAWAYTNVVFALHYAHLYYGRTEDGDAGGLRMATEDPPTYLDFCYFAFVIGMTFQVSDIEITSRDVRAVCLAQSLIAFAFNVGVLALSVNIVAGG